MYKVVKTQWVDTSTVRESISLEEAVRYVNNKILYKIDMACCGSNLVEGVDYSYASISQDYVHGWLIESGSLVVYEVIPEKKVDLPPLAWEASYDSSGSVVRYCATEKSLVGRGYPELVFEYRVFGSGMLTAYIRTPFGTNLIPVGSFEEGKNIVEWWRQEYWSDFLALARVLVGGENIVNYFDKE